MRWAIFERVMEKCKVKLLNSLKFNRIDEFVWAGHNPREERKYMNIGHLCRLIAANSVWQNQEQYFSQKGT